MEKMNQVSVSEFFAKSKEEMYDMAVEMVEKYNRLVDICNDSCERMAELVERHTVYTDALNKDISEKAAKIELMEQEIEGRKAGYVALKTRMDNLKKECDRYANDVMEKCTYIDTLKQDIADMEEETEKLKKTIEAKDEAITKRCKDVISQSGTICNLKKELDARGEEIKKLEEKVKHQRENLDGINRTLEIKIKENESLIAVRNNQDKEIEVHESENARLSEKIINLKATITELAHEIDNYQSWNASLHNDIKELKEENKDLKIRDEELTKQVANKLSDIDSLRSYITELKKKFEDSRKETIDRNVTIVRLEGQIKNLEKELDKTCTTKELDLKGHNRREMALVNELADKNDEIKSLKEENSYIKSEIKQKQNIIKKAYERYSDDIIKTRKDVLEVAYHDIEKDNGYVGFKLYVKSALIEAKGDKNEANEIITEAVRSAYTEWDKTQKENEKTIKKAIKEVMNKKYGYAGEIAFRIRSEVDKKRIVDIGEGAEKILGVSRELFDAAIKALVDDGYQEIIGRIPQATNSYVYMDMHVLATPDVEIKETANAENIKSLDFDIPCGEDAIE